MAAFVPPEAPVDMLYETLSLNVSEVFGDDDCLKGRLKNWRFDMVYGSSANSASSHAGRNQKFVT
ncbi:hypothetical protein ABRA89_06790 [Fulvimarina sp. MAC8]